MDRMLGSAEALFQAMQQREYVRVWSLLSRTSQQTIVQDTYRSIQSHQGDATTERIAQGFNAGDELASSYWNAFLKTFDPVMILEQSKWEIGSLKDDQGLIKLTYRKAEKPALLKMYREDGAWKVGLTESFWGGKSRLR